MTTQWYYQMMGAEFGPHTGAEMLELVKKHRISPEDLVRKGERGDWVAAYRIPGLFADEAKQPPASSMDPSKPSGVQPARASLIADGRSVDGPHVRPGKIPAISTAQALAAPARAMPAPETGLDAARAVQAAAERALAQHDYIELVNQTGDDPTMAPPPLDWYCICHGEKLGPLSFRRLKELFTSGELEPQGRVWSNASPKWCRAHEVPGLGR